MAKKNTGKTFTVTARVINIMSLELTEFNTMAEALEHAKTLKEEDFDGVEDSSLEITAIANEHNYATN